MKTIVSMSLVLIPGLVFGAELEGTIREAIDNMTTILSMIMVAAIAWAGFELRRGDPQATGKLLMSITGLIIVNSADAIIKFFT